VAFSVLIVSLLLSIGLMKPADVFATTTVEFSPKEYTDDDTMAETVAVEVMAVPVKKVEMQSGLDKAAPTAAMVEMEVMAVMEAIP